MSRPKLVSYHLLIVLVMKTSSRTCSRLCWRCRSGCTLKASSWNCRRQYSTRSFADWKPQGSRSRRRRPGFCLWSSTSSRRFSMSLTLWWEWSNPASSSANLSWMKVRASERSVIAAADWPIHNVTIPYTSYWFTSFCAHHRITVTIFALTIYHSLGLSRQT